MNGIHKRLFTWFDVCVQCAGVDNHLAVEIGDLERTTLRYRFQGCEWSAATGLVNFRMRWYDPNTGRWLSKDPVGLSGGLNLYAFCRNGPNENIDSYGLNVHYTSENGGHSVVWADKPGVSGKTVRFEFGPASENFIWGDAIVSVGDDNGHPDSEVSVDTSEKDDQNAIDKMNEIKANPPSYSAAFQNCADMARIEIRRVESAFKIN